MKRQCECRQTPRSQNSPSSARNAGTRPQSTSVIRTLWSINRRRQGYKVVYRGGCRTVSPCIVFQYSRFAAARREYCREIEHTGVHLIGVRSTSVDESGSVIHPGRQLRGRRIPATQRPNNRKSRVFSLYRCPAAVVYCAHNNDRKGDAHAIDSSGGQLQLFVFTLRADCRHSRAGRDN